MHVLTKLIIKAEMANKTAATLDDLTPEDVHALKRVRLLYFCHKVEGIRRLQAGSFISSNFKQNTISEQVRQLEEELGGEPSDTFRADVLNEDINAQELVELWFLAKQEA